MKIGPKYKIARRLGAQIFEKTSGEKFALREERRSRARRGRRKSLSNFGAQLIEKQKARYTYGISEKQFRKYVDKSLTTKTGSPAENLYKALETRLDNVVYRSGLAKTRRMARQMVSHGHIRLNGRKMTIPSAEVRTGDKFDIREGSKDKTLFADLGEEKKDIPAWITFDVSKKVGSITKLPTYDPSQESFDLTSVLEFYSR